MGVVDSRDMPAIVTCAAVAGRRREESSAAPAAHRKPAHVRSGPAAPRPAPCAIIARMMATKVLVRTLWLAAAACGSVNDSRSDAGVDAAPALPGDYRWVRSTSSMIPLGLADGAGGLAVVGHFNAPADLGGGPLTPVGATDALIAGLSTDGEHLFSVRHGAGGNEFPFLDVVSSGGAPIAHGVSYGDVDLGRGPVTGGGGPGADGFIGLYGPGTPGWVHRIVGPGEDKIVGVATGPGSTVYAAGWFEGTTSFNGGQLTSTGGREIFLARFNAFNGTVDVTRTYGSMARDEASGIATTGTHVVLAGMFDGTLALGGAAPPLTSLGLLDVYVAGLGLDGAPMWAVRFGGAAGEDRDPRIAVDAAGDIYIAGQFRGQVAFGAVNLISNGGADVFVAKLRGENGTVAWATSFGAAGDDGGGEIAVDAQGRVAVVATVSGPLDGSPATAGLDAALLSFDGGNGARRWHHVYSTPGDDRGQVAIYGRDGDLYAGVSLAGPFDFGRPVLGAPNPAAVLMRIVP